jgi:hypothetical protein
MDMIFDSACGYQRTSLLIEDATNIFIQSLRDVLSEKRQPLSGAEVQMVVKASVGLWHGWLWVCIRFLR